MAIGLEQIIGYILNAKDITGLIISILKEEESWLRELAEVHRKSALQGIEAARNGDYDQHMRVALGHLRDVYNLLEAAANKPPSLWEKINEFYGGSPRLQRQAAIAEEAIEVALLISEKHWELGEKSNAKDWARKALESFELFKGRVRSQPTYELRSSPGPLYAKEIKGLREEREGVIEGKQNALEKALSKYSL